MQQNGASKFGRYEQGQKYMENLEIRSKKLSADTRNNLKSLPKLYAKVDELNRKLASSRLAGVAAAAAVGAAAATTDVDDDDSRWTPSRELNSSDEVISSADSRRASTNTNSSKKEDIYLQEHKRALLKKTMVVSQCLDDDLKHQLEGLKYGNSSVVDPVESARRYSMIDMDFSERRMRKSPRDSYGHSSIDDDVIFENENQTELFSGTLGSSEFASSGGKEEFLLPPTGRRLSKSRLSEFALNLSNEGQYALLKSLEDSLASEIEHNRPEFIDKLPPRARSGHPSTTRRASQNEKRDSIVAQQIETVTQLLDELRQGEKKKSVIQPLIKKQIHFSDSGDYDGEIVVGGLRENREKNLPAASNRRQQRKSIANSDICYQDGVEDSAADRIAHLFARYAQLKRMLE